MKRIISFVLAVLMLFSLCACRSGKKEYEISYLENVESTVTQSTVGKKESSSSKKDKGSSSSKKPSSFNEFVSSAKELGIETEVTKKDDGTFVVDIKEPEEEETPKDEQQQVNTKPVIPTIENTENDSDQSTSDSHEEHDYTYTTNQTHTTLPYTKRYYYNVLDAKRKGWYRKIDTAVKNLEEQVYIGEDIMTNKDYYIYFMYMMDNPEHFYLCGTITVYYMEGDETKQGLLLSYSVGDKKGEYSDGKNPITPELKNKIKAKKALFDNEVKNIVSTIPADAPDVVKELLIYDRILMNGCYNTKAPQSNALADDNYTAYGIIINKTGVCESYSEAFQTLLFAVGINCTDVRGYAGGPHEWNCVQLDGEWYMCDVTFDDPVDYEKGKVYSHRWFNVTSAQMKQNGRTWDEKYGPVPTCNGTKYNYENYFVK